MRICKEVQKEIDLLREAIVNQFRQCTLLGMHFEAHISNILTMQIRNDIRIIEDCANHPIHHPVEAIRDVIAEQLSDKKEEYCTQHNNEMQRSYYCQFCGKKLRE